MSDVALRTSLPATRQRIADVCRLSLQGIAEGIAAARRYERLSTLSDHELARLGIAREDVPRFAVFGERR